MTRRSLDTISCDGCGVCCMEIGVPPYMGFEVFELPEQLRTEVLRELEEFPDREMARTPCRWFDQLTRKCLQHGHRPQLCRDFETGSESCLALREHFTSSILTRK